MPAPRSGSANFLAMQVDGNLVVYTSGGKPVWAAGASKADQLCTKASMSAGNATRVIASVGDSLNSDTGKVRRSPGQSTGFKALIPMPGHQGTYRSVQLANARWV